MAELSLGRGLHGNVRSPGPHGTCLSVTSTLNFHLTRLFIDAVNLGFSGITMVSSLCETLVGEWMASETFDSAEGFLSETLDHGHAEDQFVAGWNNRIQAFTDQGLERGLSARSECFS